MTVMLHKHISCEMDALQMEHCVMEASGWTGALVATH